MRRVNTFDLPARDECVFLATSRARFGKVFTIDFLCHAAGGQSDARPGVVVSPAALLLCPEYQGVAAERGDQYFTTAFPTPSMNHFVSVVITRGRRRDLFVSCGAPYARLKETSTDGCVWSSIGAAAAVELCGEAHAALGRREEDERTWDHASRELAMAYLCLGVERRCVLLLHRTAANKLTGRAESCCSSKQTVVSLLSTDVVVLSLGIEVLLNEGEGVASQPFVIQQDALQVIRCFASRTGARRKPTTCARGGWEL